MELTRPVYCKDEHLEFLDELRELGKINMFGATAHLHQEFQNEISEGEARKILRYWMESFSTRK